MVTERFGRMARVGLIADTHDEKVDWATLQPAVARAFDGVGLVLLCGDLQTLGVLDRLEELAPVKDPVIGVTKYPFRNGSTTISVWATPGPKPTNRSLAGIQYVVKPVDPIALRSLLGHDRPAESAD